MMKNFRDRNIWLVLIGLGILGGVVFIFLNMTVRSKKGELQRKEELIEEIGKVRESPFLSDDEIKELVRKSLEGTEYQDKYFEIIERERVDWPTGALGCPTPGQLYTQKVEPGYRVIVKVGSKRLEIHISSLYRRAVICQES